MIETSDGDLLHADTDAIVNAVNTVGVMGKGLALQFAKAFPDAVRDYERCCRDGTLTVGRVRIFERSTSPRFIVSFPTKKHWRAPSRLEWIEQGLTDLVVQIGQREIRSIAIPALGCGLGGLAWSEVRPRIEAAFAARPAVRVVLFEPR